MTGRLFVSLFLLFNSLSFATNISFHQQAIQTISQHFAKDIGELPPHIKDDPAAYLRASIELFKEIQPDKSDSFQDLLASMPGVRFGVSITTISIGGVFITTSGERGQAYINGKYQKTEAKTIEELREALKERHWMAVKRCLFNVAEIAQKVLVDSKSKESVELAKSYATNASVPETMRTKLLAAFASTNDSNVISWLLKQPAFKDSAKDGLIQRLVEDALEKDNPNEATNLIERHLQSGYSAQEIASKKVFNYFFNKGDLAHAEEIMTGHFTKGYSSYEGLAQDIFDSHLRNGNVRAAENCLRKHYTKDYSSSDRLVQVLVNHLIKSHLFDEANAVLNRNMTQGYSAHTNLEKHIMQQEIAFLKSSKNNV